jgi:signal transduction histidine kinase
MQNISQGIFLLNANLETQNEVSAQLPKILGIPAVAQHQNLRDLFQKVQLTDQQRTQLESQIAQAFERNSWAGDTLPEEFRVYPSQTLEVKWDPVYGQDQKLERVLVALKDVTPQRALFEQKTAMSEKMATIGELVYDLSHELRNAQLSSQPNLEVERQRFSLLLAAVEMGEFWPDLERAIFLDHKPNIQLATDCNRYIKRSDLSAPQRKFALSLLGLDLPVPLAEAILQRSQSFPLEHQAMVHALFGNLESFIQMLYSARRTAAITMSVLEHSRTDQGASYAQLSSLIESSLVLLQKKAKSLNVQVQNDLNAQLQVYVNKSEINQIVLNLVKNSLEAFELGTSTPASPRTIHLASQEMGEFTAVSIQDNAGGIPAEIIDRIFERRFSTKGEKGNGLGLYLAQKLALKNGGTLDVESTDGKTKFTLWLRRREVMEVAA